MQGKKTLICIKYKQITFCVWRDASAVTSSCSSRESGFIYQYVEQKTIRALLCLMVKKRGKTRKGGHRVKEFRGLTMLSV